MRMKVNGLFPKINDLLFIQIDSTDEKEAKPVYKSRVSEMDDQNIYIEVPLDENSGRLKRLHLGDELSIQFSGDTGSKYFFHSYVVGYHEDVIRQVKIQRPEPGTITPVQRRSFLRVQAGLELAVSYKDGRKFLTRTEDVGGGGLSFYAEAGQTVHVGDQLICWLLVPYKNGSLEHVPFRGEIVRTRELSANRKLVMLKYENITDMERQKLIRYCFERQLDFRNR